LTPARGRVTFAPCDAVRSHRVRSPLNAPQSTTGRPCPLHSPSVKVERECGGVRKVTGRAGHICGGGDGAARACGRAPTEDGQAKIHAPRGSSRITQKVCGATLATHPAGVCSFLCQIVCAW
jgi:hypothetical protein